MVTESIICSPLLQPEVTQCELKKKKKIKIKDYVNHLTEISFKLFNRVWIVIISHNFVYIFHFQS